MYEQKASIPLIAVVYILHKLCHFDTLRALFAQQQSYMDVSDFLQKSEDSTNC